MIRIDDLSIAAGGFAATHLSLSVPAGAYAVLMGRTGCGKTTLLETICGLKPAISGRIFLMEADVTDLNPAERGIGYVPQDRALFRTMTVRQHLAFALEIRHWSRQMIDARVMELAELLGIVPLLHRRPAGLSGGEAQRVALGRALSMRPGVLLLDEPLSALDDQTRREMYDLLRTVKQRTGVTTLHVTHNAEEARELADLVFTFEQGVLLERRDSATNYPTPRVSHGIS